MECGEHRDVTFKGDANITLDKPATQNQNIIRKWSWSILKIIEIMRPVLSPKKKRFAISLRPIQYLEEVLSFKKFRLFMGDESNWVFVVPVS